MTHSPSRRKGQPASGVAVPLATSTRIDGGTGLEEIVLELFENERWNLDPAKGQVGAFFACPQLMGDRLLFSDEAGRKSLTNRESVPLLEGFE